MFDDTLSKCERCSEDVRFALSSIALSLKNVANSDGNNNGAFGNNETSLCDNDVFMQMTKLINAHKNSFLPSTNAFMTGSKRNQHNISNHHNITSNKKGSSQQEKFVEPSTLI